MVHLQHDPSWKIYVCNRWKPTGSRGCWCSGKTTLILIYMKAAAMYGLAGFMLGAKSGGASVNLGYGYEMEAIAACTIGGVSVTGGRGKVSSAIYRCCGIRASENRTAVPGSKRKCTVHCNLGIVIFVAISLDIRKYVAKK